MQSKCSQNAVKMGSKWSQNSVKMQSKYSQNAVKMKPKFSQKQSNEVKLKPKCSQNSVKMQLKCSQNSVKIQSVLGVLIGWKVFSLVNISTRFWLPFLVHFANLLATQIPPIFVFYPLWPSLNFSVMELPKKIFNVLKVLKAWL